MRFLLLITLMLSESSFAQDMFNFLSPETPSTSIEVEGNYLPSSEVEDGQDKTHLRHGAVGVTQKIYQDDTNLLNIGARSAKLDLSSESEYLRDYYLHQGAVSFKRKLKDDNFWLTSLSYGSASDRPFKNGRDSTLSANYIQRLNSKWFIAGNYSNNRAFLNNIPLPGFFYIKEMTREKAFVIGFPFIYWMNPLGKDWSIRYFGLIPWSHRLRILYTKWQIINPYFGFEQTPQTFFRHDRKDRYDRFFWFERRLALGVEGKLNKNFKYDISNGLAFDRQFYEARNFSQSKEYLINLEKSYFIALNLRLNL